MKTNTLELIVKKAGENVQLVSPTVGYFTCAKSRGRVLTPGESVGVLTTGEISHPSRSATRTATIGILMNAPLVWLDSSHR